MRLATVSYVAYTVVCLVTLDYWTCGVIDTLSHCSLDIVQGITSAIVLITCIDGSVQ